MSEKKLTNKQRLFVEAYLATSNGTDAARKAGYKGNDNTLASVAKENLRKPQIANFLEKRVETAIISANEILTGVKGIAFNKSEKTSDRLKAYELLGKHLELWTEKQKVDGKIKIEIEYV